MHVHDRLPLLIAHFLNHVVPGVAGVVDDDVQTAQLFDCRVHKAFGKILLCHAADAGHGPAAGVLDRRDRFLRRGGIKIVDYHAGAFGGEFEGDFPAYPAP